MLDTGVKPAYDYHALNAMLNLYDEDGRIRFEADRLAARQYFLSHVNQNTVFFHSLEEKLRYLLDEGYYEPGVLAQYPAEFLRRLKFHRSVRSAGEYGLLDVPGPGGS